MPAAATAAGATPRASVAASGVAVVPCAVAAALAAAGACTTRVRSTTWAFCPSLTSLISGGAPGAEVSSLASVPSKIADSVDAFSSLEALIPSNEENNLVNSRSPSSSSRSSWSTPPCAPSPPVAICASVAPVAKCAPVPASPDSLTATRTSEPTPASAAPAALGLPKCLPRFSLATLYHPQQLALSARQVRVHRVFRHARDCRDLSRRISFVVLEV